MKEKPPAAKASSLKSVAQPWAHTVLVAPLHVAAAFKALNSGTAEPHQQQEALKWLIREAAGKAHFAYHENERDTVFALGRQFVGELVLGLFNADLSSLRRADQ